MWSVVRLITETWQIFRPLMGRKNIRTRSPWVSRRIHLAQSLMLASNGCLEMECSKSDPLRAVPPLAAFCQQPEAEGHPGSELFPLHHSYQSLSLSLVSNVCKQ